MLVDALDGNVEAESMGATKQAAVTQRLIVESVLDTERTGHQSPRPLNRLPMRFRRTVIGKPITVRTPPAGLHTGQRV